MQRLYEVLEGDIGDPFPRFGNFVNILPKIEAKAQRSQNSVRFFFHFNNREANCWLNVTLENRTISS